ncbi:MAG: hypothetical protein ACLRTQ_03870 [Candidatus Borkfalkia sp.]
MREHAFDAVLGNSARYPVKPDPAGTLAVLKRWEFHPRRRSS